MIVCRKCSRRHADGTDFCACGAFLEFDGEHVPDEVRPAAAPVTEPMPTSPSPAAPDAWGTTAPAPAPGMSPPAGTAPASPQPSTRQAEEPAPWSGFSPSSTPTPSTSGTGSVQAQLPDAPMAPAAPEPVDVRPTLRAGDIVCATCLTPNPPTRQFCQHCGDVLGEGVPVSSVDAARKAGRASRRRRLRMMLRRGGLPTDSNRLASEVHMLSRGGLSGRSMLFRTGGIALLLGGMLAFLGPWRSTVTAWARDRIGASRFELVDVEPEQVESVPADRAVEPVVFPLQEAERVVDRYLNTSWATHWIDPIGRGLEEPPADNACQDVERTDSFLRVTFPEPVDLARISVIPGRYDGDEARGTFFRPSVIELRWNDGECRYVALADKGELSQHGFEHDDVSVIDIRVVGVYADPESAPTVDISEIVFERGR
jgi:hypothetical protein